MNAEASSDLNPETRGRISFYHAFFCGGLTDLVKSLNMLGETEVESQ